MIKTVVREFKWPPEIIESLYLDDADFRSLGYWYNDIAKVSKEVNKELRKK